jgi:hypothetical protein
MTGTAITDAEELTETYQLKGSVYRSIHLYIYLSICSSIYMYVY